MIAPFAAAAPLDLSPLWAAPFVLLLGCIAVLPLAAEHWWHSNRNKLLVAGGLALPVLGVLLASGGDGTHRLEHAVAEYVAFIALLGSLYVVAGGVAVMGDLKATPGVNTGILALGAALANVIGTTGASMVLIRPILRANSGRAHKAHVPLFFIFTVSNTGGLLTPLGDPPLFLGFLKGVDFFWTLRLWPEWLIVNGAVLLIFLAWDWRMYLREPRIADAAARGEPLRVRGLPLAVPLMAVVLAAVLLQSDAVGGAVGLKLSHPVPELVMLSAAGLSLLLGRGVNHRLNRFSWHPILEVAALFAGIFVTMVPALVLLERHGASLGVTQPWQYFWLTGGLSAFLDNAPTYVTFGTLAAGGEDFAALSRDKPDLLAAISCGAVFMGALTYIGNGPNFMVKAIAEDSGYRMPSFFGYLLASSLVLVPLFVIVTLAFFV